MVRALPIDTVRAYAVDPSTVPSRAVVVEEPWMAPVNGGAAVAGVIGLLVLVCGGYNAFNPDHKTGALIMLGIGGGAILLAVIVSALFGRRITRSA